MTYFYDEYDMNHQWQNTVIHVPKNIAPYYQLITGGENQRFMLAGQDCTYYWGVTARDYYEVNLLYNPIKANDKSPIKPINADDIYHATISQKSYWHYWANYFAKSLMGSPYGFLYQGEWQIFPVCMKSKYFGAFDDYFSYFDEKSQQFKPLNHQKSPHQKNMSHKKYFETSYKYNSFLYEFSWYLSKHIHLDKDYLQEISWEDNGEALIYCPNHVPDMNSGRVKWWRKKIRENCCLPLFVWYQSHLVGYFLVDGHARLQAYLAEHTIPDVLMITPATKITFDADLEKRQQILQGLKNYLTNELSNQLSGKPSQKSVSMDKVNQILMSAYPKNFCYSARGRATMQAGLDNIWLNDVKQFINHPNINQEFLKRFMENEKYYLAKDKTNKNV